MDAEAGEQRTEMIKRVLRQCLEGGAEPSEEEVRAWAELEWNSASMIYTQHLIHRDIKPENVLIKLPDEDSSRPEAMLTDFGLAQAISEFRGDGDVVAGTPAYMAPEQLLGSWRDQGPWTDLYSLACTIWRIIAPEAPFGNGVRVFLVIGAALFSNRGQHWALWGPRAPPRGLRQTP